MTTQEPITLPELSPEQKELANRVMLARQLGQDFTNILGRTGVLPDLAVITAFTILQNTLHHLARTNKTIAEDAARHIARDFVGMCAQLGLGLEGDTVSQETAQDNGA